MTRFCLTLWIALACTATLLATQPRSRVEVTTSETIAFSPGGAIRIDDSFGKLHVEGWDRDEVELKVTRRTHRRYEMEDEWKARQNLQRITVEATRWSRDLHIVTRFPNPSVFHPLGGRSNLDMDYRLMVPRKANLHIRHSIGEVEVRGVSGELNVTNKVGEVALRLPDTGEYNIRAQAKIGDVNADFHGRSRRSHLIGAVFDMPNRHGGTRVYAYVGIGEVRIARWTQ
ncbi:MAG: hypothetical protein JJE04_20125 [Acidobacteriia bacterium]|nr:hypothetical protein [Terriglobia bacterium]